MNRRRAIRKLELAIDKLIDLQDMGAGCDEISRVLEILNSLLTKLQSKSQSA